MRQACRTKAWNTIWKYRTSPSGGIKFNQQKLALGLAAPEIAASYVIAPGAGAGGVGIESSTAARHFVTFAGLLSLSPRETMDNLAATLGLDHLAQAQVYKIQTR